MSSRYDFCNQSEGLILDSSAELCTGNDCRFVQDTIFQNVFVPFRFASNVESRYLLTFLSLMAWAIRTMILPSTACIFGDKGGWLLANLVEQYPASRLNAWYSDRDCKVVSLTYVPRENTITRVQRFLLFACCCLLCVFLLLFFCCCFLGCLVGVDS